MRTIAEWEALTGDEALTPAEVKLIAAVRAGGACFLNGRKRPTTPSPATTVRAKLLRLLITGATPECGTQDYGVWLEGAWITGTLDLQFARARGRTVLDNSNFAAIPRLDQADLNGLSMDGSHLPGLFAMGLRVRGNLSLRGVKAKGTVTVNGAKVGGQLSCIGAELDGAGGMALDAQRVETGQSLFLNGVKAKGMVDVVGARINGQLVCAGAELDGAGGMALNAQRVETGQSLFLQRAKAKGIVAVNGAKVGGQFSCTGAELNGAGGIALNAQGVETGGGLFLSGVKAKGTVDVTGAKVGGQFGCNGAEFDGAGDMALNAQRLHAIASFFWVKVTVKAGGVDLTAAHVGDLADDIASWPKGQDQLGFDGFTYDRIYGWTGASVRLPWLRACSLRQGEFLPQPYTQLARVLRAMGHDHQARLILVARARDGAANARARRVIVPNGDVSVGLLSLWADGLNALAWVWDRLGYWTIGYGYQPWKSAVWLFLLWAVAFGMAQKTWDEGSFAPNSDVILVSPGWAQVTALDCLPALIRPCDPNPAATWSNDPTLGLDWDSFSAAGYAADLVIPILTLGQTEAWAPSKDRGDWGKALWWSRWVLAALGWIISALGAAAITGIIQRDKD